MLTNWLIIYQAKLSNIYWFQLLNCKDVFFFFLFQFCLTVNGILPTLGRLVVQCKLKKLEIIILLKWMESLLVCLSFDFLDNHSSDWLHTWWVFFWGPKKVQCRVWSRLDELLLRKLQAKNITLQSCRVPAVPGEAVPNPQLQTYACVSFNYSRLLH